MQTANRKDPGFQVRCAHALSFPPVSLQVVDKDVWQLSRTSALIMSSRMGTSEEEEQELESAIPVVGTVYLRGGGLRLTGQCPLALSAIQLRLGQKAICHHIPCAQESNGLALLRL